MIIVSLKGGLGNQMFEYASAYAISQKTGLPLFLDISFLKRDNKDLGYTKRDYELWKFNVPAKIISSRKLFFYKLFLKLTKLLGREFPFVNNLIIRYGDNNFVEVLKLSKQNISKITLLDGYWQSEIFFKNFKLSLAKQFTVGLPIDEQNQYYIDKVTNENSVSIHVRRTDYISNTEANSYHGLCSLSYYNNAINFITSSVPNPVFYIFSDDMLWVKQELIIDKSFEVNYVEHNNQSNHFDLILMQHCKHNIIANSSFSWWGAWLNLNPNKIVVAPKEWFAIGNPLEHYIVPQDWLRIF